MVADDRVRIEIAFDGGQVLAAFVPVTEADDVERALAQSGDGAFPLEAIDRKSVV